MTRDSTRPTTPRPCSTLLALAFSLVLILCAGCGRRIDEDAHSRPDSGAAEEHRDGHDADDQPVIAEHDAREHAADEGAEHDDTVPLAGVRGVTFAAVGEPVEEGVWYPGEATAASDERAMLTSPVAGVVIAIEAAPGREVGSGAPLLTLRSPELAELAAAVLETRATRDQAATELAREHRLAAANAGAARELEAAQTALAVADARANAALLALEARGIPLDQAQPTFHVRSPYRGRVAAFDVLVGEAVGAGQRLGMFETARASLVRLELPLPGPSTWEAGVETTVRRGDGKTWKATVEGLPASLSTQTRRLTYHLRITGGDPPYPGTPLEARVPLPPGIVVPQDAVQQIEGQWGVFAIEEEEARFVPIRRGPELGGDVIVLEGLEPGRRIATEGAYLLKALALKRSGGGDEHAH